MIEAGGSRRLRPLLLALALPLAPAAVLAASALHAYILRASLPPPPTVVSERSGASMAYDPERRVVVLFGGERGAGTQLDDTWTWDGADWHIPSVPTSPPPRSGAALAWDGDLHRLVLFGGRSGGTGRTDTWTWDGARWEEFGTWSGGELVGAPSMTWDERRHQLVLVASVRPPAPTPSSDGYLTAPVISELSTWVLQGSSWVRQTTSESGPAPFDTVEVAGYDPVAGHVVLLRDGADSRPTCGMAIPDFAPVGRSVVPGATPTPGPTPTPTAKPTPTAMPTPTPKSTPTPTPAPTATPTPAPTATPLPTPTPAPSPSPALRTPTPTPLSISPVQVFVPPTSAMPYYPPCDSCPQGSAQPQQHGDVIPPPDCPPPPTSWGWDGAAWRPAQYDALPALGTMAPAQDPRRTQLLVFAARRLWGWDGHAWVVRSGSLPLEDRTGVALAGDAARGTVVAVGGVSPETQQPGGDTWTWNGRDWTYRSGVLPMVAPVSSAEAGADCRLDAAPDQDARPDGHGTLSLRIRFDWSRVDGVPIGCARSLSVSIRLVDAGTQRGLPIQDNNRAIKPRGGVVTLTWTNWCPGPNQVAALSASARGGTLFWPVVAPPPCLDRSRPSMLSISPGP